MPRETFRKQITSPELWEQVNNDNKKLMERFLRDKSIRSSGETIKSYRSDLQIFFTWNLLENNNKHFTEIKKLEFAEFFSFSVEDLSWKSSRFSRVKSVLSSFSNFIEMYFDEDFPAFKNIILRSIESMPKEPSRDKSIFTEEQVEGLLNHLTEEEKYQEACWLSLVAYSGARFSELLRFKVNIIDESNTAFNDLFLETTEMIRTKGRGREGKKLYKYIIKDLFLPHYRKWIEQREKILIENNKVHDNLFIKSNGDPAGDASVRAWIQYFEKYLGVPVYPHAFRHFFVTQLARIGLSQDLIIEVTGWTSGGEMYKLYCDLTAKDREWKELDKLKEHIENK